MGDLDHAPIDINSANWGHVRVTIADNVGQGNGGTSIPCVEAWMIAASGNAGDMRVRVGDAATATTGIPLAKYGTDHWILKLPIADVADLYFYSSDSDDDVVDVLYRR